MADEERTQSLLEGAGFTDVRLEDVPVCFVYGDVDEYVSVSRDTGGAFAIAFREASEEERDAMRQELAEAFVPFAVDGRLELPGVALAVVAS